MDSSQEHWGQQQRTNTRLICCFRHLDPLNYSWDSCNGKSSWQASSLFQWLYPQRDYWWDLRMDWEEGVKILGSALGPVTSRETFLKKITASVLNLRIWLEEVLETSARYQLRMGWRTFVQICSGYKVASYEHERLEFNWVQKACVRLHWHNPISNFKEAIHANMNFKRKHFIKNENVFA